jgi:hypothetical protein
MPDSETSRERWDREDKTEAQRAHELELERLRHPTSEWAITFRVVGVWAVIAAVVCFYIWRGGS